MGVDLKYFQEGMHSDNDVLMQPENTYRRMVNGNIMNLGGGRFSVELTPGNIVSFFLPNSDFIPIGFISFVSFLAVISTNTKPGYTPAADATEIGTVTFSNNGIGTYTPLYHHLDIGHTIEKLIEGHGREENQFIKRGYWTDNHVPPKVFNFADKIFTTYFTVPAGPNPMTTGNRYMVLSGKVTNATSTYGAGLAVGTVFTADGTETFNPAGTIVIEYFPVELLDWIPSKNNGTIRYKKWQSGGNVLNGMYQFAFQLEGNGGVRSGWSYVTRLTHVTKLVPNSPSISYQNYQGGASTIDSGKKLVVGISDIDTFYTRIRVAVIRYGAYNVPSIPELFFDGDITGSSMDVIYSGGTSLLKLTNADITQIITGLRTVKTIVSFKNMQFPMNISEFSDVDVSFTPTINVSEYEVPSDIWNDPVFPLATAGYPGPAETIAAGYAINGHGKVLDATVGNGVLYSKQWYKVLGTTGVDFITYNAVNYGPGQVAGDVFQADGSNPMAGWTATTGTPKLVAILHISKYGSGAGQVFDDIYIEDDWCDSKGMVVQTHLGSSYRGETVRLGLMFYDLVGNPLFVKCIGDKAVNNQYDPNQDGVNLRLAERYDVNNTTLRHIGFNISGIDFNDVISALKIIYNDSSITLSDISKYFGGFSIVRAPREGQILAQGLLFPTILDIVPGTTIYPQAFCKLGFDAHYNGVAMRMPQTYLFYSPENLFGTNGLASAGDYLQIVDYYDDVTAAGNDPGALDTNNFHYYSKYYDQSVPGGASSQKGDIAALDETKGALVQAGQVATYGVPGISLDNSSIGDGAALAGFGWGGNRDAKGSRTTILVTTTPDGVNGFGDNTINSSMKALVNWIRPNTNPYGGTSDSAKANTKYAYAGHYQKFDAAFIAYLNGNAGIADNIQVFGGDCYVTLYDLGRMFRDNTVADQFSSSIIFPVESLINTFLREGRHFSKDRSNEGGTNANGLSWAGPTNLEEYTYNGVYSSYEKNFIYSGMPVGFIPNSKFDKRARYSNLKFDGETIDSFRIFLVNNFREAEGICGEINNAIVGINHLFYIQNRGVGYFPVNERETVTGPLGSAVQLGVGGILDRFDNISTFYGNQHQWGVIRMPDRFAWFDMRNRQILMMAYGSSGVMEYSIIKGLESDLMQLFDDIDTQSNPSIFDSDQPLLNRGISGTYDPKYKMGLMTFRYKKDDGTGFLEDASITLGLNKTLDKFIGWFDFCPGLSINHQGHLLSIIPNSNSFVIGHAYKFGDTVAENNVNYVCIKAFTPTGAGQKPSTNAINFKQINSSKQIFVSWRGKTGQFFGKVYNHSFLFVVNKDNFVGKTIDTIEINGSSQNYDVIKFTTDQGTVTERTSGNRNYKYFDSSWQSSVPLFGRERLTDNYLMIEAIVENFLTDPTISLDKKKSITSIQSIFRYKK